MTLQYSVNGILPLSSNDPFYPLESILLALALLALVRCRSLEQSRYLSPGEWGKLLGLDRMPELKTLRRKISELCGQDAELRMYADY